MSTKKNQVIIRNFRGFSPISDETNRKKWSLLESELVAIFNSANGYISLEELYRIAQDLYSQNYSPLLYNLEILIEAYLNDALEKLLLQKTNFLPVINDFWNEFYSHIKIVKNIFINYDRSSKFFKYNTVQSISTTLFTNIIIYNPFVKRQVIEEINGKIEMERLTLCLNQRNLIKSIIEMLHVLQIYEDIFLQEFFKWTQQFYRKEAKLKIEAMSVPEYLKHVNQRIIQEQQRANDCFNKATETLLLNLIHKELIENHMTEILDKGFAQLIQTNIREELILIHELFEKVPRGTKELLAHFQKYITSTGTQLCDVKNSKNMIQDLLDFKDKLDEIILLAFGDSKEFHECVRCGFKNFINNSNAKTAQLLAKFLDSKLRSKALSDDVLEIVLSKTITLFKHIQGKDIFETFYKKFLAKRLLLGKSTNQEAENSMITKLKEECGSNFTSNIEGMFQDIHLSYSINATFKQKLNILNSDFCVNILMSSFWPNFHNCDVNLPMDLISFQQNFQAFYLNSHSGRKLLWQPSLGFCLIKANFDCGLKELQVSLFQAIVLLVFNSKNEVKFKEIQEITNLETTELKRTLFSLIFGKAKILTKVSDSNIMDESDVFIFNHNFTDRLYRVKLNQIQLQETPEEENETEKNVLVDRQFQIDAAIVRIMKDKKRIKHNSLVKELYQMLEIPVNQSDLKKRIELLIEREYMERDRNNKSHYLYIA